MISKACQYGLRALVFLASQSHKKEKFGIIEIATAVDAPLAFTAKILRDLSKNGVISSHKGPSGGFYLTNEQLNQPVLKVVESIDGLVIFTACGLGLKQCSESHPCPMHDSYKEIRDQLYNNFRNTSLFELASFVNDGNTFINNPTAVN